MKEKSITNNEVVSQLSLNADLLNISNHLSRQQGSFLTALEKIASKEGQKNKFGWDLVDYNGNFALIGIDPDPRNEEVFTGKGMCTLATHALYDALKPSEHTKLGVKIYKSKIYFNKKIIRAMYDADVLGNHMFVAIMDGRNEGNSLIIDPTYSQIDPGYTGQFLFAQAHELAKYYRATSEQYMRYAPEEHPMTQHDLIDITADHQRLMKIAKERFNVSDHEYQELVKTVSLEK